MSVKQTSKAFQYTSADLKWAHKIFYLSKCIFSTKSIPLYISLYSLRVTFQQHFKWPYQVRRQNRWGSTVIFWYIPASYCHYLVCPTKPLMLEIYDTCNYYILHGLMTISFPNWTQHRTVWHHISLSIWWTLGTSNMIRPFVWYSVVKVPSRKSVQIQERQRNST